MHRPRGRASRARFPVIVRTLRGLEAVARDEVEAVFGPIPVSVEHRALRFSLPCLDRRLLALGTVDDAFLLIGEADGIGHRRGALRGLASLASTLDFQDALSAVASLRRIRRPVAFDVTASFVGPRNYSRFEIEDAVGRAIATPTGWSYRSRSATRRPEPTSLSVRVHVLHTVATLSVRLAERPLHRRDYRVVSRRGALHPPLARALSLLADPAPGHRLVDPACGVGTIPIEAALLGRRARPMGFDLAPAAVHAARVNAARARVDVRFGIADAARLRRSGLWTALARVLADDGRLVALVRCGTVAERDLRRAGLDAETVAWLRVSGAEAVVLVAAPAR